MEMTKHSTKNTYETSNKSKGGHKSVLFSANMDFGMGKGGSTHKDTGQTENAPIRSRHHKIRGNPSNILKHVRTTVQQLNKNSKHGTGGN